MWWSFKNALARKLAYVLVGLLAALILGHRAYSQTMCPVTTYTASGYDFGHSFPDVASLAAAIQSFVTGSGCSLTPQGSCNEYTYTPNGTTSISCSVTTVYGSQTGLSGQTASCGTIAVQATTVQQVCSPAQQKCQASEGQTFIVQGTNGPISGTLGGNDNCQYQAQDGVSLSIAIPTGMNLQTAVSTGQSATPTAGETVGPEATSGQAANACITLNGNTTCLNYGGDTPNCGFYNGDMVCVGSVANNTCAATASGGAVCAAAIGSIVQSPPAPDNGTPGTPATPAATFTDPSGNQNQIYTAGQVKGSSGPVQTSGTTGTTTSPTGATTTQSTWNGCLGTTASPCVTTQAPSAANGDCAATGTCATDGTVPTLGTTPTVGDSVSAYWSALGNVPIVAAFSGILNSLPSAQCPTYQLSMFQETYTMDQQCTILDGMASVVAGVMIAIYTLTGLRILMST